MTETQVHSNICSSHQQLEFHKTHTLCALSTVNELLSHWGWLLLHFLLL